VDRSRGAWTSAFSQRGLDTGNGGPTTPMPIRTRKSMPETNERMTMVARAAVLLVKIARAFEEYFFMVMTLAEVMMPTMIKGRLEGPRACGTTMKTHRPWLRARCVVASETGPRFFLEAPQKGTNHFHIWRSHQSVASATTRAASATT
jgi:hypothetical protein